jgi:hypothetical protein
LMYNALLLLFFYLYPLPTHEPAAATAASTTIQWGTAWIKLHRVFYPMYVYGEGKQFI